MAKQRSQGGGRKTNSEPRVQRFNQWNGMNIQYSPRDFVATSASEEDQTDLQMNFTVIQNNVSVTNTKTLETRSALREAFSAPTGLRYTGPCCMFDNLIFLTTSNGRIERVKINPTAVGVTDPTAMNNRSISSGFSVDRDWVTVDTTSGLNNPPRFESVNVALGQLIACGSNKHLYSGSVLTPSIRGCPEGPKPTKFVLSSVYFSVYGNLYLTNEDGSVVIGDKEGKGDASFRIGLTWTYLSKFGPTRPAEPLYFYCNKPTTEWNSQDYIMFGQNMHDWCEKNCVGIELYYTEGNYQDFAFLDRMDFSNYPSWEGFRYTWTGTSNIDNTSVWAISNLSLPDRNYSGGAPCTDVREVDGRLYFFGGDPGYRLWIGGNPGNELSVSDSTGGGFVDINPGSDEQVVDVEKYKTQSGNSIVTILCSASNTSREFRYNLVENAVTLSNEQSIKGYQPEQVGGAVGTRSGRASLVCEDGLYTVNRYGVALTTMTMEYNSQIKVNYISDPIEPVFKGLLSNKLENSIMLNVDGKIFLALGDSDDTVDNVLFVYDVGLKAWWTYSLDIDAPILNMFHFDNVNSQEGIGIVTANKVYLLPTTLEDDPDELPNCQFLIETAELSTQMPIQGYFHLTQLEFRFDRFIGNMKIECICIDQFGRRVTTVKNISYNDVQYGLVEWMRIDLRCKSYKLRFTGEANFRMTHFMAKLYTLPNRVGIVWGFDDSQTHNQNYDIHPTFKNYNDLKNAIIP